VVAGIDVREVSCPSGNADIAAQFGQVQSPHQRLVLTPVPLVIHQQSHPLQQAEFASGRILLLRLQSIRHAVCNRLAGSFCIVGSCSIFWLVIRGTPHRGCCRDEVVWAAPKRAGSVAGRASSSDGTRAAIPDAPDDSSAGAHGSRPRVPGRGCAHGKPRACPCVGSPPSMV